MIGIYKITSPTGRVYIGQSINIPYRITAYKRLDCKSQRRLYQSFLKHGVENHIFEIVEYCGLDLLNERELFYIKKFNCLNKFGLNCYLIGAKNMISDRTREKMSISATGRVSNMKGKKHSQETRLKMSKSKTGMVSPNKGKHASEATKKLQSEIRKGKPQLREHVEKRRLAIIAANVNCKKIIDTQTGIVYISVNDAAFKNKLKPKTLSAMLSGQNKNKTNLTYFKN